MAVFIIPPLLKAQGTSSQGAGKSIRGGLRGCWGKVYCENEGDVTHEYLMPMNSAPVTAHTVRRSAVSMPAWAGEGLHEELVAKDVC